MTYTPEQVAYLVKLKQQFGSIMADPEHAAKGAESMGLPKIAAALRGDPKIAYQTVYEAWNTAKPATTETTPQPYQYYGGPPSIAPVAAPVETPTPTPDEGMLVGGGQEQARLALEAAELAQQGELARMSMGQQLLAHLSDIQRDPFSIVTALKGYGAAGGGTLAPAADLYATGGRGRPSQYGGLYDQILQRLGGIAGAGGAPVAPGGAPGGGGEWPGGVAPGAGGATPPVGGAPGPGGPGIQVLPGGGMGPVLQTPPGYGQTQGPNSLPPVYQTGRYIPQTPEEIAARKALWEQAQGRTNPLVKPQTGTAYQRAINQPILAQLGAMAGVR